MSEVFIHQDFFRSREIKFKVAKNDRYWLKDGEFRVRIFTPQLWEIFNTKDIPNRFSNKQPIDGTAFCFDYLRGYKHGLTFFEENYKVSNDIIYNNTYIESLNTCYLLKAPGLPHPWKYYITSFPLSLSASHIERYGFCSGVCSKIFELIELHPSLKAHFDIDPEKKDATAKKIPFLDSKVSLRNNNIENNDISHREEIFAYEYKWRTGYITEVRNGAAWKKFKGGKGRIATVYSEIQNNKSKSKPTRKELEKIISLLEDFPKAKKAAEDDLKTLLSL